VKLDGFIEAKEAAGRSVKHCCDMFQVSRAAYYQRQKQVPSARERSDGALVDQIRQTADDSDGTSGAPRVHRELLDRGVACGRRRARRQSRPMAWRAAARSAGGRPPSKTPLPRPRRWT
jgi:hypothetical protein